MATEKFSNTATTTLNGAIGSGDSTLTVASAVKFPLVSQFRVTIDTEILLVTGVAGNVFTVTRGAEGTTAASHNNGALVAHILTSGALDQFRTDIEADIAAAYCTLTDSRLSDDRTASGLRTATTVVSVSSATAPTLGQVLTATGGTGATWQTPATATGVVQCIRFEIGTGATQDSATSIPAAAVVQDCAIRIDTPYSPGTTITVGSPGVPNLIQDTGDNDPTTAALWKAPQDTVWGTLAAVRVTVGGAPSTGAGYCIVNYVVPNA